MIMTMEYVCDDDWGHAVYKCLETNRIYKDANLDGDIDLYTCDNMIDGDLTSPIRKDIEVIFKSKKERISRENKFNYMLLSRLKTDCDYYLGHGGRCKTRLFCGDEQEQIDKMKEMHNNFKEGEKPEWLTFDEILEYERLMLNK